MRNQYTFVEHDLAGKTVRRIVVNGVPTGAYELNHDPEGAGSTTVYALDVDDPDPFHWALDQEIEDLARHFGSFEIASTRILPDVIEAMGVGLPTNGRSGPVMLAFFISSANKYTLEIQQDPAFGGEIYRLGRAFRMQQGGTERAGRERLVHWIEIHPEYGNSLRAELRRFFVFLEHALDSALKAVMKASAESLIRVPIVVPVQWMRAARRYLACLPDLLRDMEIKAAVNVRDETDCLVVEIGLHNYSHDLEAATALLLATLAAPGFAALRELTVSGDRSAAMERFLTAVREFERETGMAGTNRTRQESAAEYEVLSPLLPAMPGRGNIANGGEPVLSTVLVPGLVSIADWQVGPLVFHTREWYERLTKVYRWIDRSPKELDVRLAVQEAKQLTKGREEE